MSELNWYVVHTYSGYENKVKTNLEKIIENRGLHDKIVDIRIPVETHVEVGAGKDGKDLVVEEKIFPSYVLVKMVMTDETWHVVRNISGVTGFVGPGSKPTALSDAEVAAMGIETPETKEVVSFKVGDTVEIKWQKSASMVQIQIKDNGCGIHPEDIHHIFKRFYRSRFSKDKQGLGLGLPLAKMIIEAHNGTIEVTSELQKGTTFTLNFLNPTKL